MNSQTGGPADYRTTGYRPQDYPNTHRALVPVRRPGISIGQEKSLTERAQAWLSDQTGLGTAKTTFVVGAVSGFVLGYAVARLMK